MPKQNGIVLYRGPSQLDGAPIVAILTGLAGASANEKTGAMLQTWIMREDVEPHKALKTGEDASVCGDCKHRPANGGACYVTVFQAPLSVYRAFHRGAYGSQIAPADAAALVAGRALRVGSYGDPAAVPAHIWQDLVDVAATHTGYTHQWHKPAGAGLRGLVMASADSADEMASARAAGWRTFRVRCADEPLQALESVCPASEEAGYKTNCATCGACSGADGRRGSIAIVVHGAKARKFIAIRAAA